MSTHRLHAGIYTWLFENLSGKDGAPPGFFVKAGIGMAAGCCGAFVGTPAEVALIRMTSDGNLPANQRRNYKNAFEALVRIPNITGTCCILYSMTTFQLSKILCKSNLY